MNRPYYGITHEIPTWNWVLKLWKKFNCTKRNVHCFDEVWSPHSIYFEHYLVCDACELMVEISSIDTKYVENDEK